ncbi:MAG: SGNH/GDSL hydrolase family protein [Sulfitobacter sp.]
MRHALAFALTLACAAPAWAAEPFTSPDILILGDSQIPFGTGPVFLDFFKNLETRCNASPAQKAQLSQLDTQKTAVIGVRSSSLHSWTARSGKAKGAICDVDPKWKVNAGTFGTINTTGNKYAQIGRGRPYQFCKKNHSAFEAMFAPGYYAPKLLFMSFLGNSTSRWSGSRQLALQDVKNMLSQVPQGTPCVFMTTLPSYSGKVTAKRLKAQENIRWAFKKAGKSCTFIEGANQQTIAANQGNRNHFRRTKAGKVKDIYHPNERAARKFFSIEMKSICKAVFKELPKTAPTHRPTVTR